ncbi:phosphatidylserine lipase ABHD16A [Cloeon dipterum]|uniref:phosphatidylserine lipase ABHD16A n=1 Tax=Cloeon dipterum TaxID=197152 RepID=UPI00321FBB8F
MAPHYFKLLMQCLTSPRLYRIHAAASSQGFNYEPKLLERWGDVVIKSFWVLLNLKVISIPVLSFALYRKCYVGLTGLGLLLAASYGLRAVGRSTNEVYISFLKTLTEAQKDVRANKRALQQYDFDFSAWPVEFKWNENDGDESKQRIFLNTSSSQGQKSLLDRILSLPVKTIGYLVAHSVGYKLMFPGSIQTLQFFIDNAIVQGRIKLIEEERGERFKMLTRDGNELDAVFVDKRKRHDNGDILVICCEGNAGFYEIGIMATPLGSGYSVLGWNYPGFGWSSGYPYPDHVVNGVDVVMQFAIHKLHFQPENIILYAWSIGGYALSWASMNYPEVKGAIVDASFDDVVPLAQARFPSSWGSLVKQIVHDYMNLNNAAQLARYPGPILFVRRTQDEIIAIDPDILATNRGNNLVIKVLQHRYPRLVEDKALDALYEWLSTAKSTEQNYILKKFNVDEDLCASILSSYVSEYSNKYPMMIGGDDNFKEITKIQLTLFLARRYLLDYNSTHCTPLPVRMFVLPWDIAPDSDFVKL